MCDTRVTRVVRTDGDLSTRMGLGERFGLEKPSAPTQSPSAAKATPEHVPRCHIHMPIPRDGTPPLPWGGAPGLDSPFQEEFSQYPS